MTQKWNLQDIRPAAPRTKTSAKGSRTTQLKNDRRSKQHSSTERDGKHDYVNESLSTITIANNNKKNRKQLFVAAVIFFVVVGAGVAFSAFTVSADITLYPKVRDVNVNAQFTTYNTPKPGELSYEVMTLNATSERQVKATGQEQVHAQATGEIEITKLTPGTERLIKNTRFTTVDGLIFRIQESVVVPGAIKNADGDLVPGAIQTKVFADQVGDKYNIKADTKFTVPGFKEGGYTNLYDAIKASNPNAFNGGFDGPKFIVGDTELTAAKQSLQTELHDTLLSRVKNEKPAGFTSFDNSIVFSYIDLPPVQSGDSLVTIREQATLQIPLFKDADFSSFIAKQVIAGYDTDEPVRIDKTSDLTFAYTNSSTTAQQNIANLDSLTFTITGTPRIVWDVNEDQMKLDLLGREKTAFTGILAKYPGINKGEVIIHPFWKRSFPDKLNKININDVISIQ